MSVHALRLAAAAAVLALAAPGPARSADWKATAGELGRGDGRFALHIGGNWGSIDGSEVENVDPAVGFEGGASVRVLGSISLFGSYAIGSADVKGQVVQLLDQKVRPDGRSGNVDGQFESRRIRAGVRIDALRQEGWQWQPYLLAAAVFATNEVKVDTVDGRAPRPVPDSLGREVDISTISDDQIGGLGRFGLEYRVTRAVGVDLNFSYEVLEFPPGTAASASLNGGLTLRL